MRFHDSSQMFQPKDTSDVHKSGNVSHIFIFLKRIYWSKPIYILCVCVQTQRKAEIVQGINNLGKRYVGAYYFPNSSKQLTFFLITKLGEIFYSFCFFLYWGFCSLGKNFLVFYFVIFFQKAQNAIGSLGHISMRFLITEYFLSCIHQHFDYIHLQHFCFFHSSLFFFKSPLTSTRNS